MTQTAGRIGMAVVAVILAALIGILEFGGLSPALAQANTLATGAPSIEGAAQLDEILLARTFGHISDADGMTNPSFRYQWISNDGTMDTDIDGATGISYTIAAADVGNTIKVRVSFTDDAGNPEMLTSAPTEVVSGQRNSPPTGLPTIGGTPQVGQRLTVNTSGIADADGLTNVSYGASWYAGEGYLRGQIGQGYDLSYTVSRRDVGMTLDVTVNFKDDAGKYASLTSGPTAVVAATSPAAPENFAVSPNSTGYLDLSWQAPTWDLGGEILEEPTWGDGGSPITGYVVQWKEAGDSWDTEADVSEATVTGTTHTITGLTDGADYSIRVLAVNEVGRGIPSDEATVTVDLPGTSTDATLSGLALSGVAFGTFAPERTSYTAQVANSVTATTVTATVNHSGATHVIKLGSVTDADAVVPLSVGSNVITIEVTAEDGNTTRAYTVTVTRAARSTTPPPPASDASLGGLALSGVDFGTFASETTSYTAQVANSVTETTVTATVNNSGATHFIKLGGVTDSDGVVPLSVGSNVITIEVTAEDGNTTRTYTVTVTRAGESTSGTPTTTDPCLEDLGTLTVTVTKSGSWASDCPSANRDGRYARYYSFTLGEEREVTVDLTSSDDTFLFLLQGSGRGGEVEAQNDDIVSGNTDSRVVATLAAGSYTIEATTYNAATTGTFSLSIALPEESTGSSPTTDSCLEDLGTLTEMVTKSGSWASDCPSDNRTGRYARYYSFALAEETEVTIDLSSSEDTFLFLLQGAGKDGAEEAQNDDIVSGNTDSRVVATLAAGSYTIEATTYNAATTGTFSLSIALPEESTGSSPTTDSCLEDLGTLTETVTKSGSWASDCPSENRTGRYARYYSFTLGEETEVTIDLTSGEDTFLFLLQGAGRGGTEEAQNDDIDGSNRNSRIVVTLAAGSYTLEATTYDQKLTGSFTVTVSGLGTGGTTEPDPESSGDQEALVAFYNATGGADWANKEGGLYCRTVQVDTEST